MRQEKIGQEAGLGLHELAAADGIEGQLQVRVDPGLFPHLGVGLVIDDLVGVVRKAVDPVDHAPQDPGPYGEAELPLHRDHLGFPEMEPVDVLAEHLLALLVEMLGLLGVLEALVHPHLVIGLQQFVQGLPFALMEFLKRLVDGLAERDMGIGRHAPAVVVEELVLPGAEAVSGYLGIGKLEGGLPR